MASLRPSTLLAAMVLAAMAVYALTTAGPYGMRILTIGGIYALNVIGYQFIFGHAGALSLAQGTFFGLGAYTAALLGLHLDVGFLASFPAAILVPTAVALVIAIPVLRLETHYLALATLGISQVALLIATNWQAVTGGANGLPNVPGIVIFGHAFGRGMETFLAVWLLVGLGLVLAARILSANRRLTYQLQREKPLAAQAVGIDRDRLRLAALVLSAGYGGAAGALYVHTTRVISPDALAFSVLVLTLAMTVIGGRLSLAGAVIGGLLLTLIPEWFRFLDQYYLLATGTVMLAMVVFAPNGLSALADRLRPAAPAAPQPVTAPPGPAPVADDKPALSVAELIKRFGGVTAVDIAELIIPQGQVCGAIGPNGSGKTTLLNLVSGFVAADAGTVAAFGHDLTPLPAFRRAGCGVARCFQHALLLDDRTVFDNVASARDPAAARAAIAVCGLDDLADRSCGALSFGRRRLVELARALAGSPRLVLLDEPAAGLSEDEQMQLAAIIAGRRDLTWLVVDHNTGFLAQVADRLVCLDAGRVIADGTPEAALADPAVRTAVFGEVPA